MAPGLLHVTMDPAESLPQHEFHDWYNNEHGPTRLRLPFFTTGLRYTRHETALTSPSPPWLAIYDMTDLAHLETAEYLRLRSPPVKSQREMGVMKQIAVDRRCLETISDRPDLKNTYDSDVALVEFLITVDESIGEEGINAEARRVIQEADWDSAWDRVTCYQAKHELLVLCRVRQDLLDTQPVVSSTSTLLASIRERNSTSTLRIWKPYYTFGPAPRHLSQQGQVWTHHGTRTTPATKSLNKLPAVESYVTLKDGTSIPYRLEGSTDPNAPVICLVNSVMVHWDIWDEFLKAFFSHKDNMARYRVLRFSPRGRFAPARYSTSPKVTVDLLVEDITELLKALVISQVECIMGVSLGGATALRAGLLYLNVFKSFVACDTNASSPPGNAKLWAERIAIAEKEGSAEITRTGVETIIGEELAEATIRRWAAPGSLDDPELAKRFKRVKAGVKQSSLEGFKQQVQALYEYDFWEDMKTAKAKGAFLVGAQDGKLPDGMRKMAEGYGTGARLHAVEGAGHLPMVERPEEVAQILCDFLSAGR